MARGYLNWEQLVKQATSDVPGLSRRSADLVAFASQQVLEAASPANHLLANPELLELTRAQSGQNLVAGFKNWLEDIDGTLRHKPPAGRDEFKVGVNVAVTPGKVVYRNELIELIQYGATTPGVHPEPILIVPAWIMKYYILDLSPRNSLVRYLVDKGHTVFMISWKNPNEIDRNLGMDDYHNKGIREALSAVGAIVPNVKIHAVGYCIGGTLLSIAAAALAREGDRRLASMTLFAAQTDFSEPGELSLFISPSQLSMLEAVMHKSGVLSSDKMGASFALLRSRDLLWTPAINSYVKGSRAKLNDLMAWNSDGTRMPWRMHTEYLNQLYLQNDLAGGRFRVNGEPIDLASDHSAHVRARHRDGSRRTLAVDLQGARVDALGGLHLRVDQRRPQRRHRQRSREPQAPLSREVVEGCRKLFGSGPMDATGRLARGLVVARLAGVAGGAFGSLRAPLWRVSAMNPRDTGSWAMHPATTFSLDSARRRPNSALRCAPRSAAHCMCWPPLMAILAPVTNAASSLAK